MKKIHQVIIMAIVVMFGAASNLQAQTTMELLTSTNWEPQNFFDKEGSKRGYKKFTTTSTFVKDKNGEIGSV